MRSSPRPIAASVAALLGIALVGGAAAAQDGPPDRIDLPDGWAPEGITALDGVLYGGSLSNGGIFRADPATGEVSVLVAGSEGAVSVGLDPDAAGRLWVVSGPGGGISAYDSATGEELGAWTVDSGFLNDVAVTDEAVFVTDSFVPQLVVLPLPADGDLETIIPATIALSGDLEYGEGFNLNGIVAADAGLVVIHSPTGGLYALDPQSGVTTLIDTGDADLSAGDGLELDGERLYVVRNRLNEVVVVDLSPSLETASLVATITADDLDIPTTAALVGDDLWAVNARFGTDAGPETEYWITRIDTPTNE